MHAPMDGPGPDAREEGREGRMQQLLSRIDTAVQQTEEELAARSGASPQKRRSRRDASGRRMTELEEDEDLLEYEMEEEEEAIGTAPIRLVVQPPNIVGGTLRDYQLEGLNWLVQLYRNRLNGILADDMGLGKTIQAISLMGYLAHYENVRGPYLIVAPLSTLGNWMREIATWCPTLRALKFHGSKEDRVRLKDEELQPGKFDVVVTSYEMAITEKARLKRFAWEYMIVDEAHRLKNEESVLSRVVRTLGSKRRLLLTGTPLQNNLHELWALLNFLMPDKFGSSEDFDELFRIDPAQPDVQIQKTVLEQLHRTLRPFMLRRNKADVETSLLPKIETLVFVGMSLMQRDVYQRVLMKNLDAVQGPSKEKTRLLNIVMQLRKAANHPYLFEGVEDRTIPAEQCEHLVSNSGKMVVLDKLLRKLKDQGSRVLLFSQMTRMLDILEDYLIWRGYSYCRIDGSTNTQQREERIWDFNLPDSDKFIFLLSTRAGGLGINLATADVVILYDSDWNPQMDLQAQDRAHRIGQKKQVYVYRLTTEGTIEEKIIERAEIKLRLDALIVEQGRLSQKSQRLDAKDMQEMIRYGADKIFRTKGSTVTDEDIDLILARGTQKTQEFNEKLQKHVGLIGKLTLDGKQTSLLPGSAPLEQMVFLQEFSSALPKRERRKNANYDIDAYYRETLTTPKPFKSVIAKPMKIPKMLDFQFFNQDRIMELCQKEQDFWAMHKDNPDPPAQSGLTAEEEEERQRLLDEAFSGWNTHHFQRFIRACERFGRGNVERIAESVLGQAPEEVKRYHDAFWRQEKYKLIKDYEKHMRAVQKGEEKLALNSEMERVLQAKVDSYGSIQEAREKLRVKATGGGKVNLGFTPEEDSFLLVETRRIGYGGWDQLRMAIRQEEEFRFDYFLKSRTAVELHRRVDALLRGIMKERQKSAGDKIPAPKRRGRGKAAQAEQKENKDKNGEGDESQKQKQPNQLKRTKQEMEQPVQATPEQLALGGIENNGIKKARTN